VSFDELKRVLESLGLPGAALVPDATREEAGLDSLAVAELGLVLRREHGIDVTDEEIHDAFTLSEVAALVDGRRSAA
jgi:acyl carrier protein